MRLRPKPIRVYYSPVTGRFYATAQYRIDKFGRITVTGRKWDVTQDLVEALADRERDPQPE